MIKKEQETKDRKKKHYIYKCSPKVHVNVTNAKNSDKVQQIAPMIKFALNVETIIALNNAQEMNSKKCPVDAEEMSRARNSTDHGFD